MNVPKLRFGEFCGEWENTTLGQVTLSSGVKNKLGKNYPVFSISNKHGFIPQNEQFENSRLSELDKSMYYIVKPCEFAYNPARINVGSIGYQNLKCDVIVSSLYDVFKTTNKLEDNYFIQYLSTKDFNNMVLIYAEGSVRQYLFYNNFKIIPFKIPSLPEQEKIADFLSSFDEKIETQQQIIKSLEQQKKGFMQKIFSQELRFNDENGLEFSEWEEKKLGEAIEETQLGGNYANTDKENINVLIKMGNLGRGKIVLNKIEYIEKSEIINSVDLLKEGDLLFNTRNTLDLVGKTAIWRNEIINAYFNSNIMRITFKSNYVADNRYINYCLNTRLMIKKLRSIATGTTSVAAIYYKDTKHLTINLAPLPEQQKIADFLSAYDEKIDTENQILDCLKKAKKGLLQQMFC